MQLECKSPCRCFSLLSLCVLLSVGHEAEGQICFLLAECHPGLSSLTSMDLSEIGGEYCSLCSRDYESNKILNKRKSKADELERKMADIACKSLSLATKKWKDRLLQVFELLVFESCCDMVFDILHLPVSDHNSPEEVVCERSQDDCAPVRESSPAETIVGASHPRDRQERRPGV